MRNIISKIKVAHVIILLLVLILIKLNAIANSLEQIYFNVDLGSIEASLEDITSEIQSINWNGIRISR